MISIVLIIVGVAGALLGKFTGELGKSKIVLWGSIFLIILGGILAVIQTIWKNKDDAIEKAKQQYSGKLQAESRLLLSAKEQVFPVIEIGDSGTRFVYTGDPNVSLFNIFGDSHLGISLDKGQVLISCVMRDKEGKIVAELKDNEWKVQKAPVIFDRNFDKNAVEVVDAYGSVILQVLAFKDKVQFQGKFYSKDGECFAFISDGPGKGAGMHIRRKLDTTPVPAINKLFKYPSDQHLGERN